MSNPIQYTSRTYNTILNDINAIPDLADKPEWFKRLIAGRGDVLSAIENASANQAFLRTAFTRRAVADLLELIDYYLASQDTSSGYCIFHLNPSTVAFPVTYTAAELTALSEGTIAVSSKSFEARTGETMASTTGTFTASAVTDILTVSTNFSYTGHLVRVSSSGTLPTGLSAATDYFVVYVSATEIRLATSLDNANAGTYIDITGAGTGTHTWTLYSFSKLMYQQEQKDEVVIGETDGLTEWQEFTLPDQLVLTDTLSVRVGGDSYTAVDSFVDSSSTDKHYRVFQLSDDSFSVRFGNGVYGAIPAANTVYSTYSVGGGSDSNISNIDRINIYSGGSSTITGLSNVTTFTGGDDQESIESGKRLGPLLLKARDRFVTTEDGESLALSLGGLSKVKINKNVYGVLTCQVLGVANGGGNPGSTKQTEVEDYLTNRSVLEEAVVTFDDATLTAYNTTVGIKVNSGVTYVNIEPYIELAIYLFWSETGQEIIDKYTSDTLNNTITLINSIFSTTFTESADGTSIQQLLTVFNNLGARDFGETIQQDDLTVLIRSGVNGIDYLLITLPVFPISFDSDEISTHTAMVISLSEIT